MIILASITTTTTTITITTTIVQLTSVFPCLFRALRINISLVRFSGNRDNVPVISPVFV